MAKQNIYDNDAFFAEFKNNRGKELNFNDVIEAPIITAMLPELTGRKVLDIGCGMGQHAVQYAKLGAASVLGTDISEKMLAYAAEHNTAENITYRKLAFEELEEIADRFDVITSSLASFGIFHVASDGNRMGRSLRPVYENGDGRTVVCKHP